MQNRNYSLYISLIIYPSLYSRRGRTTFAEGFKLDTVSNVVKTDIKHTPSSDVLHFICSIDDCIQLSNMKQGIYTFAIIYFKEFSLIFNKTSWESHYLTRIQVNQWMVTWIQVSFQFTWIQVNNKCFTCIQVKNVKLLGYNPASGPVYDSVTV